MDGSLTDFCGPDGLMQLLELLATEEVEKGELIEIIKRIHMPNYEHTRLHFNQVIRDGVFEPNVSDGYYWQSDMEAVLAWLTESK